MQGGDGIVFIGNGNDFRALQKGARLPCIRATGEQRRHHLVRGDGAACRCGSFCRRPFRALYIPCRCGSFCRRPFRALYILCRCGFFFGSPFPFAHIPRRAHAGAVRKIQPRRAQALLVDCFGEEGEAALFRRHAQHRVGGADGRHGRKAQKAAARHLRDALMKAVFQV